METFGFFQLPISAPTEPSPTASAPESAANQPASPASHTPRRDRPQTPPPISDEVAEMAQNPVFWMMP